MPMTLSWRALGILLGVSANTPTPADLFMQSVVKRDAAMGWHQLCSSVQSQVPLSALVGQVEKQRIAEAGTNLLERGYLLVFEALQIPTNEGSPRIQQSKMMLSQRSYTSFAGVTQTHRRILFRPETHCVLVLRTHPVGSVVYKELLPICQSPNHN